MAWSMFIVQFCRNDQTSHGWYGWSWNNYTLITNPSDWNESHVGNFRMWVLYIVLKTTSLALKWHQKLGSTYLFDKVTDVYVFTLGNLIREKHIESLFYSSEWNEMQIPEQP